MRFQKGSLEISRAQDLPLLRQILRSRYATHDQVFEFMRLGCHEVRRQSFNWRIKRLVDHQMVLRHYAAEVANSYIYCVAPLGILYLQALGEYCTSPVRRENGHTEDLTRFHSIELNELQLALARHGLLEDWIPENEIRSKNELTSCSYAKDYDAVVTLRIASSRPVFALEYERSAKTITQYQRIAKAIDSEASLLQFVYLATNGHLQSFLLQCLSRTSRRLYVGLAKEFCTRLLKTTVIEAGTSKEWELGEALTLRCLF